MAILRFFDFEFAGFRHALLDAAYLHSAISDLLVRGALA
jgi:hypothetical protein